MQLHSLSFSRQVKNAVHPPGGKCKDWTLRMDWYEAKNVTIDVVQEPDPEPFGASFYTLYIVSYASTGQPWPHLLEGEADDYPLIFKDKRIISVSIDNVYIEGLAAIPYTDCEVYTPLGYHTEVFGCFTLSIIDRCAARP